MTTILGRPPAEKVNILFAPSSLLDAPSRLTTTISMMSSPTPPMPPEQDLASDVIVKILLSLHAGKGRGGHLLMIVLARPCHYLL